MIDRDCANCSNRSDRGCKVWECEFKPVFSESKQPIIDELQNLAIDLIPEMESIDDRIPSYIKAETVFRTINKHIAELKGGAE